MMYVVRYRIYNQENNYSTFESVLNATSRWDAQDQIYAAKWSDTTTIIFIHNTVVDGMYTRLVDEDA